jgi:hypothetical protein
VKKSWLNLWVLLQLVVAAGCGSGTTLQTSTSITSVSDTCSPTTIQSAQTSQCTATVQGTGSFTTAVNWTASAGTIATSGIYTAPTLTTATQVTITATSVQDPTKSGSTAAHLKCNPKFILCGEAPSHRGCRHSGIAFTSEHLLLEGKIPRISRKSHRLTIKKLPYKEGSATIVWNALYSLGIEKRTILWNTLQCTLINRETNSQIEHQLLPSLKSSASLPCRCSLPNFLQRKLLPSAKRLQDCSTRWASFTHPCVIPPTVERPNLSKG